MYVRGARLYKSRADFVTLLHMRNFMWGLCLSTLIAMTLQADVTAKDYREGMALSERTFMKVYIRGLGEGIGWANTAALSSNNPPLYCQPAKLALGFDNFIDILNRKIEELSARKPASELDKASIGMLLLMGLQTTFPCTNEIFIGTRP